VTTSISQFGLPGSLTVVEDSAALAAVVAREEQMLREQEAR